MEMIFDDSRNINFLPILPLEYGLFFSEMLLWTDLKLLQMLQGGMLIPCLDAMQNYHFYHIYKYASMSPRDCTNLIFVFGSSQLKYNIYTTF